MSIEEAQTNRATLTVCALTISTLFLVLAGFFFLGSCRDKEGNKVEIPKERMRGTIRLPLNSDIPTLDPIHIIDVRSAAVARQIFSTLIRFDSELRLIPDVAESWEVSEDKLRFRFKLRRGVKFHNGREVKAEDFVYSFNRLANPKNLSERATLLRDVVGFEEFLQGKADSLVGVQAISDYELEIKLQRPYVPFLSSLAIINFAVVPKEEVEKAEAKVKGSFSKQPIGSGPFKLAEWLPDSYIRIEANADYFRGPPRVKSIVYKVIPDLTTQFEAYKNDEIDTSGVPIGNLHRVMADKQLAKELHRQSLLVIQYYVFNLEKPPFKDILFESKKPLRQAINYAIDRDYICREILEERYQPFVGIIPPALSEWYNPENRYNPRYKYDVDKARELMEKAGYPQGLFLPKFEMFYNNFAEYPEIALQVADFLADVSIKVEPRVLEWATFLDTMQNGDFVFGRSGWVADFPDPDNFLWQLLSSENLGPLGNWARFKNEEFDKLVRQARVEPDKEKRKILYWQAEKIALEEAPWLFLFTQVNNVLIKPWIRGVKPSGMDVDASLPNVDFAEVYISEEKKKEIDDS